MKIRIAIAGYGNLGRGVECAIKQNNDMELVAVFQRRDPATVQTVTGVPVVAYDQIGSMADDIDVKLVNAENGDEGTIFIKPAETKKNVVIIGAGLAGLEAARVAGIRGHNVDVYEKEALNVCFSGINAEKWLEKI